MELKQGITAFSVFIAGVLLAGPVVAAEVYRWVDENGEVHYSESLPPDYEDKGYDVLNSSGLVTDENQTLTPPPPPPPEELTENDKKELPRDQSGLPRPKALYSEAEMQSRMDNFLMLRYESEQEIIDAMNVEIKQLEYDRRLLETTRSSMLASFRGEVSEAANQQRAGTQVSDEVSKNVRKIQTQLLSNQTSLNALEEREVTIRSEFDQQLVRYRFLLEEWAEESGDS